MFGGGDVALQRQAVSRQYVMGNVGGGEDLDSRGEPKRVGRVGARTVRVGTTRVLGGMRESGELDVLD